MGQPGMRVTVDAAMRARDVSRPAPEGEPATGADRGSGNGAEPGQGPAEPARRTKAAKNERRRLGKRGGARKPPPPDGI
ncbi:hypothetical protein E1264_09880 [Actinomadura sp. KC216]|uniref:hypothetical protein n=1 Tax=Actinomadura sp. KC216 TaxID=2530370 RepID=UPI0010512C9A|nr:hypothetical protein [Actinomadura sp. KC216]TDB88889.1 hypothetical protein E1264_09880 [Actinomadura sp. KC216]